MGNDRLADSLDHLADLLAANPSPIVGMKVVATGDGKGRSVTGVRISVAGGSGSGSTTGLNISVAGGQRNSLDQGLIEELKSAAAALRSGSASDAWIGSLLARIKDLGNRALDVALEAAIKATIGGSG